MDERIVIQDCGDSAVIVTAVEGDAERRWEVVHALATAIEEYDAVPTYDSLLVEFDCATTDHEAVRDIVRAAADRLPSAPVQRASRRFVVPVVYGGEHGPDLPLVAEQLGLTEREVVERHSGTPLTVRCLGAPAGAPMMDGPPFPKPVPRLASPRTNVPPGSVAVAGRQAVISPMPSPGGWPLLGRTPLRVLDLDRLAPYRPGDRFQFVPIEPDQWDDHAGTLAAEHG